MNTHFTIEQKIVHHLILHTFSSDNIGLFDGKTGIALVFYIIGRKQANNVLTSFGDKLLENIIGNINKSLSYNLHSGLCGIGWIIDFLLHEDFIEGKSYEICQELDKQIIKISPKHLDTSLEFGVEGLLHYVMAHLYNCSKQQDKQPFDSTFLKELYHKVLSIPINEMTLKLQSLCDSYISFYLKNKLNYDYDPTNFIKAQELIINENNIKDIPLFLSNGLSGYLIKKLN